MPTNDPRDPDAIRIGVRRATEAEGGKIFAVDEMSKQLPEKIPGRHRWASIASYTLTDTQAAAAAEGARVVLKPDMLFSVLVGCIDCEFAYVEARIAPCPAGDEWNARDGS